MEFNKNMSKNVIFKAHCMCSDFPLIFSVNPHYLSLKNLYSSSNDRKNLQACFQVDANKKKPKINDDFLLVFKARELFKSAGISDCYDIVSEPLHVQEYLSENYYSMINDMASRMIKKNKGCGVWGFNIDVYCETSVYENTGIKEFMRGCKRVKTTLGGINNGYKKDKL